MKLFAKQSKQRYLISTDGDPKTPAGIGLLVNTQDKTVQRVPSVQKLMRQGQWKPLTNGDPTLDNLVQRVPALRRHRGIEVRLATGETAWVCWRQWSSVSAAAESRLAQATASIAIPAYEPDGDYFLAVQAVTMLGGEVLDPPRSVLTLSDDGY